MKHETKIVFIGTPEFGAVILKKLIENEFKPILVIASPDKPVGRKQIITPPPVKVVAKEYKIPVLQNEKISNLKSQISNLKPDLIIVAGFCQIIPKEILEIPKYGSLNIHPSLLPKYRGCSPIHYTILNGDEETGVTIILMNEKADQGPIVAVSKLAIGDLKMTTKELEEKLTNLGAELLIKTIPQWLKGEIKTQAQDESKATYTKTLSKEIGFIDWTKPAQEIERQVRAFCDCPGAFCKMDEKIVKIWKVSVSNKAENESKRIPGKIYLAPNDKIAVQCGKDYLIIEELQLEGKRRMKVEEFLKGHTNFIGEILH